MQEVQLELLQKKAWMQTRTGVLWQAPGFAHIFYTMMNGPNKGDDTMIVFTPDLPMKTMGTDGERIFADPPYFFALSLGKRIFGVVHEIAHAMFDHCGIGYKLQEAGVIQVRPGVELPYDPMIGNKAMDYIINDMLIQAKIGEFHKGHWLHDTNIGTMNDSFHTVYERLYKQEQQSGGGGGGGGSGGKGEGNKSGGGQDDHLQPGTSKGKDPAEAQRDRKHMEQQWRNAIQQAAEITKRHSQSRGDGSDVLVKFFEQFLEPEVSWIDHIAAQLARKVGSGSYDFRRPDRRLIVRDIYAPGRSGHGCGTLVVAIDSSGSIYAVKRLIERFFGELSGMFADLKPRRIVVIWCDAEIKRVDDIEDEMDLQGCYYKGAAGGGGTSFIPPFEYLREQEIENIDALIYLTDGYGTFPTKAPKYPVIWGSISTNVKYPFGEVVQIPTDGTA